MGRKATLTRDEIADIVGFKDTLLGGREKLVIQLADALSATPADVSEALWAELAQAFKEEEIIELAALIAQENFRARFNRTFNVSSAGFYQNPGADS